VGFVDEEPEEVMRLPYLGKVTSLPALLRGRPTCDVIVADATTPEAAVVAALQRCDQAPGEIYLVPRVPELHPSDPSSAVWGYPLVHLRRAARRSAAWRLKRASDVVTASLLLFLSWPLLCICALAVRLEGGPGVIFKQERVGVDDRRFLIWKLRSLAASHVESAQRWSITGDPGLGRVGRVLRTTSLDELPQLYNIIRGDMSMVGPRPERPFYVEEFSRVHPHYAARHRAPAGLTGLAQVNGLRGNTDISERARFDNRYITDWSLWEDIKIILRTAWRFMAKAG
jgi:lipopolysaccharide/colanic/teichoic acid biosynthesis glycosyltransferase